MTTAAERAAVRGAVAALATNSDAAAYLRRVIGWLRRAVQIREATLALGASGSATPRAKIARAEKKLAYLESSPISPLAPLARSDRGEVENYAMDALIEVDTAREYAADSAALWRDLLADVGTGIVQVPGKVLTAAAGGLGFEGWALLVAIGVMYFLYRRGGR